MKPRLVLVGPPGVGKSTVGKLVAERVSTTFRDTDDDIVASAGKTISEIFIDEGETHFRSLEQAAVATALREHEGVLSLGGGAVMTPETQRLLEEHNVVFLSGGLASLSTRTGLGQNRPVLALNPRSALTELLAQRLPLYRRVARTEIVTDGKTPEQVADEVVPLMA